MARQPEVFVRELAPEEAQRLVKVSRTAKDRVRLRRAGMILASLQPRPGKGWFPHKQPVRSNERMIPMAESYLQFENEKPRKRPEKTSRDESRDDAPPGRSMESGVIPQISKRFPNLSPNSLIALQSLAGNSAVAESLSIQRVCDECGRHPHKSNCSRNKKVKQKAEKKKQEHHAQKSSYDNLNDYRSGWIKRNGITAQRVADFCEQYSEKRIRGHGSGDNTKPESKTTTRDCNAYKSWHTANYGWSG